MTVLKPRRLLSFFRRNASARHRWEYIGLDRRDAYRMMDGSTTEDELRARGGFIARRLAAALEIDATHRVLEVGCGVARVGRELAPLCGHYQGVDISRSLLEHARRRTSHLDNVALVHLPAGGGLASLPAGDTDRVICHKVLLHVDAAGIRSVLTGVARVLRRDGLAYLDLWNADNPPAAALREREAATGRGRRQPHRSRFYSREVLESWLRDAGLDAVWLSDRTFLLQAVVMRGDAAADERYRQRDRLRQEAVPLLPTGELDFEIASDVDTDRPRGYSAARRDRR